MRDPLATGMRRTFLAPLVMLQERSERGRQSLLQADAKQASIDSLALTSMKAGSLESENDRLRKIIGLGSRLRWGFIPTEALHGRGVRDETTVILSAGSRAGVSRSFNHSHAITAPNRGDAALKIAASPAVIDSAA